VTARTILLVEDDPSVRLTCAALLEDEGHCVLEAGSLAEARAQLRAGIDAAVIDLNLPDGLGTVLAAELRARHPATALILMTGADLAAEGDIDLVVVKGDDPTRLGARVEAAIERRTAPR
jgi:DNA-binding response OmpR family regulator